MSNSEQLVLYNMYNLGMVSKEEMSEFKTKEFTIRFERKPAQLWYTDNSYKYLCIMTFIDNITGRIILSIQLKESDVFIITDAYEEFMGLEVNEIYSPIIHSSDNNEYCIFITKNTDTVYDDLYLTVYQSDPINRRYVTRVKILLSSSEFIDLFDLMYFTFLIDIVSNNYEEIY